MLRIPDERSKYLKNSGSFLKGHEPWNKGKTGVYSKETLDKMGESHKGQTPWNKGKADVYSEKTKRRISDTVTSLWQDPDYRNRLVIAHTKIPISREKLQQLYYNEGKSLNEIATIFECGITTIWHKMNRYEIPRRKTSEYLKGKSRPPEVGRKISIARTGQRLPSHEVSLETRRKISQTLMGHSIDEKTREKIKQTLQSRWEMLSDEERSNLIKTALKGLAKKPTSPEVRVINIIKKHRLPYYYCGNGTIIIGSLNPDFINCNGVKKLIEVFGVPFHDPNRTFLKEIPLTKQEEYRKAVYASLGFDCLVLWDDEMIKLSDETIANKIKSFTKSKKELHHS